MSETQKVETRNTVCRLCRKETELCNSHIVPEFMYQPVYSEGRMIHFEKRRGKTRPRFLQKGIRQRLLCRKCEAFLNDNYECANAPVWKAISGRKSVAGLSMRCRRTLKGTQFLELQGFDYTSFKLLLLSILWKASVSSLENYSSVALGRYQDIIREMLIEKKPGQEFFLPCLLVYLTDPVIRMVSPAARVRLSQHNSYQLIVSPVLMWFFVSSRKLEEFVAESMLKENGSAQMMICSPGEFEIYRDTVKWLQETKAHSA